MTPHDFNPSAHHQAAFVDREVVLERFEEMIREDGRLRVLWVHGGTGTGKSMLVQQIVGLCDGLGVRPLLLEWRDSQRYGYLETMRRLRDQSEAPSLYNLFNEQVNQITDREYRAHVSFDLGDIRDVEVFPNGEVRNSDLSIHIGHSVDIADLRLNLVIEDEEADEARIRRELSASFLPCFQAATRDNPSVVLLDGIEKADPATRDWVMDELVEAIWKGTLRNVWVVITSWDDAPEHHATRLFDFMEVLALERFRKEHIREYLGRRGIEVDDSTAQMLVDMVLGNSDNGLPIEVAKVVNNFLRAARKR